MALTHIGSTARGSFNALRFQGILATECYAQIVSMLETNLSPDHALLFAEPVHDGSGDSTDWYTARKGTPVRLIDLPEAARANLKNRIASLADDIQNYAQTLADDPSKSRQVRGNILALALLCPGDDCIYVVDGEPVLIAWGFAPASPGAIPEDVVRLGTATPLAGSPGSAPTWSANGRDAPGRAWLRCLGALLLGLLAVLALFFLVCLLFGPGGCASPGLFPAGCCARLTPSSVPPAIEEPASAGPGSGQSLDAEREKERTLRGTLADLRAALAERIAQCPRVETKPRILAAQEEAPPSQTPTQVPSEPRPPAVQAPVRTPPADTPADEPAEESSDGSPDEPPSLDDLMPVTPDSPAPEPREQENTPGDKAPAPGEEMHIPAQAPQNKDMSFLEGCWSSESGLVSTRSREPLNVQYCFDAKGDGRITITETRTDTRCQGPAKARFDAVGKLVIDASRSACNSGGAYVPQHVECTQGADGKAECYGKNSQGNQWRAVFRRQ